MPDDPRDSAAGELARPDRRDFLTRLGVGACAAAAVGSGVVTLDFLKPKVLFEPPTTFQAGDPGDYTAAASTSRATWSRGPRLGRCPGCRL